MTAASGTCLSDAGPWVGYDEPGWLLLPVAVSLTLDSVAFTTDARTPCIEMRVGMASRAMCLSEGETRNTKSTAVIFAYRDRFKVGRVNATAIATEVIKNQPSRNGPDCQFVSNDLCLSVSRPDSEMAIALHGSSHPLPARAKRWGIGRDGSRLIDFYPKAFGESVRSACGGIKAKLVEHRKHHPFGVMRTAPARVRPLLFYRVAAL